MVRDDYIVGLDLGQAQDFTALTVIQPRDPEAVLRSYDLREIDRAPKGTRYPDQVRYVCRICRDLQAWRPTAEELTDPPANRVLPRVTLVVDSTGVGRPVVDMFLRARPPGVAIVPLTITGALAVAIDREKGELRVPKRELAAVIAVLLQSERLRLPARHPLIEAMRTELAGFRAKIDLRTGHDSYGAGEDWRSAPHDDLVLSLAIACWFAEHRPVVAIS